jgi:hypothetical protein
MENTNNPQPNFSNPNNGNGFLPQKKLPNAVAVLVLGIISIPTCFCYGIVGLACGIIALVLANKDLALYKANPQEFEVSSFNNLKAGRVCAIIGLSLSALYLIYVIVVLAFLGTALTMMPFGQMH